jgi:RHS repeat-associated protein
VASPRGTPVAADDVIVVYFAERPVAQVEVAGQGEAVTFLTTDHLGAPALATNRTGGELWSGGFEPFGEDWNGARAAGVFLRLPGQWADSGWGRSGAPYYSVNRWYLSHLGTFSRVDPLGIVRAARIAHPLTYAESRPTIFSDPLGLDAITSDPLIQRCFYCLFQKAGFGRHDIEQGAWIFSVNNSLNCKLELSTRQNLQTAFKRSNMPSGTVAIVHTHPTRSVPQPVKQDPNAARTVSVWAGRNAPIYTVHRDGIFKYDPQTGMITQEEPASWSDAPKKDCKTQNIKPCQGF